MYDIKFTSSTVPNLDRIHDFKNLKVAFCLLFFSNTFKLITDSDNVNFVEMYEY